MSEATNIMDLPLDPIGGQNSTGNNVNINANENEPKPSDQPSGNINLDESTISQIVNGLQQAGLSGMTQLPSRDISMSNSEHTTDTQTTPNYVPPPPKNNSDYIKNEEQTQQMSDDYDANMRRQQSLDNIYDDLQIPIFIAVLYFLFQLPFFKKLLFNYVPFLFSTDGNLNVNGIMFNSTLFGLLFFILNKTLTYL